MDEEGFRKKVERKLRKLYNNKIKQFAWRCGVRALPFLGKDGNFDFWEKEDRQEYIYSVLYALDSSATYAANAAFPNAAYAAANAAKATVNDTVNDTTLNAAFAAAYAATYDSAYAATAAYAAAKAFNKIDILSVILQDLNNIQNKGDGVDQQILPDLYGEVWDNFQKALDAEGCGYWGQLYKGIFDSGFVLDQEALERRINVPSEVRAQGAAAVANYLEELEIQGEGFVYEAKLIIAGEPGAGKTSLSKKLMDPNYVLDSKEQMTKGIDIEKWHFSYSEDIPFQCNIWDFGGQAIMKSTHRYFLTKRSLYIVVADNRKEDIDFYYWLNNLELLSEKSPVLIVLNEKHNYKKFVPEDIVKTFKSVQGVFNVNLADNTGLNDLSNKIQQYMRDLPHVGKDPIPKKWVTIRKKLEANNQDYITINDYKKICNENGIKEEKQAGYISEFLHDLGVILHFQKDRILCNTVILNTRWATEAVYQVLLDGTIIENGGEFDNTDLRRIWEQPCYQGKHAELIQLMLNFELCYEIGNTQKYIIPELLPDNPPSETAFWSGQKKLLHFEYRYSFMPKGIISRLIVRMNKHIYERQQWKKGVVLEYETSRAEIVENVDKRVLKIRIAGNERQDALAVIRKEIKELHGRFDNLSVKEMVPCNCPECKKAEMPNFFDYDELRQYKEEDEKYIKCRVVKIKDVEVLGLISDVITREDDKEMSVAGNKIHIDMKSGNLMLGGQGNQLIDDKSTHTTFNFRDCNIGLQGNLNELAQLLTDGGNDAEAKELANAATALKEAKNSKSKEEVIEKGIVNRVKRLVKDLEDKDSKLHKTVKGIKNGIGIAQDIAKGYNDIAQWLGFPQVPKPFLK